MSWVDALYFTASTVATVGYGDFSFIDQHTWLRLWGIGLIFAGLLTTAILVAFIADLLLLRRFVQSAGRRPVRHLRDHIVVVGLVRSASGSSAISRPPDTTWRSSSATKTTAAFRSPPNSTCR